MEVAMSENILQKANAEIQYSESKQFVQTASEVQEIDVQVPSLDDVVLDYAELMELDIDPPEMFIDPFIARGGLVLVFAQRGVGKTWFAMQLALSLANGEDFFAWSVPCPRKILFIDGEMALTDIKYRISRLAGKTILDNFRVLPSELLCQKDRYLNIYDPVDQALMNSHIEKEGYDVVILDNLSSLSSGRDENSNSDIDPILQFLRQLRHKGLAVILVHHAGKNGKDQRGASRLEDIMDTSIRLSGDNNYGEGASFTIEFTKNRRKPPKPSKLRVSLDDSDGNLKWEFSNKKPVPNYLSFLKLIKQGAERNNDLIKAMGFDKSYVSKEVKKLIQKGLVERKGNKLFITPHGKQELQLNGTSYAYPDYEDSL
jgi:RecA-family ATPase